MSCAYIAAVSRKLVERSESNNGVLPGSYNLRRKINSQESRAGGSLIDIGKAANCHCYSSNLVCQIIVSLLTKNII